MIEAGDARINRYADVDCFVTAKTMIIRQASLVDLVSVELQKLEVPQEQSTDRHLLIGR